LEVVESVRADMTLPQAELSDSGCVPGLEAALKAASLSQHIKAAGEWCVTMGARDLEEVLEEDVFDEFANMLKLRPLEHRRLRKTAAAQWKVEALYQQEFGCDQDMSMPPQTEASSQFPYSQAVFVKNTFINDAPSESNGNERLQRFHSSPPTFNADNDESSEGEGSPDDETPQRNPARGLQETITLDGYEPSDEWDWIHGDYTGSGDAAAVMEPSVVDTGQEHVHPYCAPIMSVVMVPVDAVTSQDLGWGPAMCFPGCVAMSLDRYDPAPEQSFPLTEDGELGHAESKPAAPEVARAQVLQSAFSVTSNIHRIRWAVDSRKLRSTDREAVSPPFELSCAGQQQFKMIIKPRVVHDAKDGRSFKKAKGKGIVQLRCLTECDANIQRLVTFRISVGNPSDAKKRLPPRGPVHHDFALRALCGLPEGQDEWDFNRTVDRSTRTFVICLEILSNGMDVRRKDDEA
jgi:hypothetical protein